MLDSVYQSRINRLDLVRQLVDTGYEFNGDTLRPGRVVRLSESTERQVAALYEGDIIPEENETAQVWRVGPDSLRFREHFFWRYTDIRFYKWARRRGWLVTSLDNHNGLEDYLRRLEDRCLIKNIRWTYEQDPYGQIAIDELPAMCKLHRCTIVRG